VEITHSLGRRAQNLKHRTIRLAICLANDGTAPAEDIDVFMHFPDGFVLTSEDDFPDPPQPPKPPSKSKTQMEKLRAPLGGGIPSVPYPPAFNPSSIQPPSNVSAPSIKRTRSYDVNLHVRRIKHKLREPFDTLCVVFKSFESAHSFHIAYEILAADLPSKITGDLHIIIQKESG
jgi:hypothetical protein